MDDDLVSKKELLDLTGISYGQLYRWKRKQLIPEEWFIRKSTFTGQETFFPKDKMLARVAKIMNMKDDLSLDDIADMFSPTPLTVKVSLDTIIARDVISEVVLDKYLESHSSMLELSFHEVLYLYVLQRMLQTGNISLDEGRVVLQVLEAHYAKLYDKHAELVLVRKMGMTACLLIAVPYEAYFDGDVRIVEQLNVLQCVEDLKAKLA